MLLYHYTEIEYLEEILLDGKLKPSSKTKNCNYNPNNDTYLPYIYFNTIPKTKLKIFGKFLNNKGVGILFDQSILLGKKFYLYLKFNDIIKYKIYEKNELRKILYKLYNESVEIVKKNNQDIYSITVFQEVFTKFEPSLKNVLYIIVNNKQKDLIKKINKLYPNIKVLIT